MGRPRKDRRPSRTDFLQDTEVPLSQVSATERERILFLAAKYDRRGWTQREIAEEMSEQLGKPVSNVFVSECLKDIREAYKRDQMAYAETVALEKLEQLRDVRKEAWAAWEKSKEPYKKVTIEYGRQRLREEPLPKGRDGKERKPKPGSVEASLLKLKRIVMREGRLPVDRYLAIVLDTLKLECQILGLISAPDKDRRPFDNGKRPEMLDFDSLVRSLGPYEDELNQRILEVTNAGDSTG